MFDIGAGELFIVFLVILVLYGPDRIPELARRFGKITREVRNVMDQVKGELTRETRKWDSEVNSVLKDAPKKEEEKPK